GPDRPQRPKLGLPVEPVARLRLEGRRALAQHPAAVPLDRRAQAVLARGSRGADRREDAAARRVQLLVRRTPCAKRELLDAVTAEAGVRMAVHQPGDRTEPRTVELLDVAARRRQVAHRADGLDPAVNAEHVGVLDPLDLAERLAAQRGTGSRRRGELLEVANQE